MKLSPQFKLALLQSRLSGIRTYELAKVGDISSSLLSGMLHDARPVMFGDPRITKIGRRLGLRAAECFEADETEIAS